jgi:hypothetical protein
LRQRVRTRRAGEDSKTAGEVTALSSSVHTVSASFKFEARKLHSSQAMSASEREASGHDSQ